ncbi:MAG TPA: hypothetical protein VLG25_02320 [Patescibacteria group bacterium]|nr:hypothetical protein [Patescibacteria group bacterium]
MKRVFSFIANKWRTIFIALSVIVISISLLWAGLASLLPGVSNEEVLYSKRHANLRQVADNPINIIHGTLTSLPQLFNIHNVVLLRSVSSLFALAAIIAFYYVVKSWHTPRVAILSTLLFASSSWFLHLARLGLPDINFTLLIVVIMLGLFIQKGRYPTTSLLAICVVGTLLIYTPGMIWFIIPALIWQRKRLNSVLRSGAYLLAIACVAIITILLAPLIRAAWLQPEILRAIAGLPEHMPTPAVLLDNFIHIPLRLFFRGPSNQVLWLSRMPLLDVFSSAMIIVGAYSYWFKRRLDRTKAIAGMSILSLLLVSLGGPVQLIVLAPVIYLLVAAGLNLMLQQWFTVFPRNPLARTIGKSLIMLVVLMTVYYNVNHYFIAWPNTPETKAVFSHSLIK